MLKFFKWPEKKPLYQRLNLKQETVSVAYAMIHFLVSIFFIAASFGGAGKIGHNTFEYITKIFGFGYYLLPLLFAVLGVSYIRDKAQEFSKTRIFGSIFFILSGLGLLELVFSNGGSVGFFMASIDEFFGKGMSILFYIVMVLTSIIFVTDDVSAITSPKKFLNLFKKKGDGEIGNESGDFEELTEDEERKMDLRKEKIILDLAEKNKKLENDNEKIDKKVKNIISEKLNSMKEKASAIEKKAKDSLEISNSNNFFGKATKLPPISLLSKDKGKTVVGDIKASANVIKRTLKNFGVEVEMEEISVGPTVTRYAFKPVEGVRLAKIAALKDDLALALAAKSIRLETPIPGKSLVGIEVPNQNKTMVGLGSIFSSEEFQNTKFELPLGIGKDIAGTTTVINLAKAPHMLIAGTTGSGKSVMVHTIINSLLYKRGPDYLKFIMIDPKRVELTLYNGIPHLLTPVITEPKKAVLSLKWAVKEMNKRYDILEKSKVRDISSYHKNIFDPAKNKFEEKKAQGGEDFNEFAEKEKLPEAMPYIVVIIDELADIMQAFPKELESGIVSLAQMSRAVGIHLILSTQRPSVNVITGLIKANVPTRLALQVSSSIDSRTILDQVGAETLLGQGDMLYMTGSMSKPVRTQGAFISEDEVKGVVSFLKKTYKEILPDEIDLSSGSISGEATMFSSNSEADEDEDPLFEDVKNEVILSKKASTSYIQRKFRVGYSRAARLIDLLEEKGVIGPLVGTKREILFSHNDNSSDEYDEFSNENVLEEENKNNNEKNNYL